MNPPAVFVPAEPYIGRFWDKVEKEGPVPPGAPELGPCWLWLAGRTTDGYGNFRIGRRGARHQFTQAHRFAYALLVGFVGDPEETEDPWTLDHLCLVRHCVNPGHMELVRNSVNASRAMERRGNLRELAEVGF